MSRIYSILCVLIVGLLLLQACGSGELRDQQEKFSGGQLKAEGQVDGQDRRQGEWKIYNRLGDLIRKEHYTDGELKGEELLPVSNLVYDNEGRIIEVRELNFKGELSLCTSMPAFMTPASKDQQLIHVYNYDSLGRLKSVYMYNADREEAEGVPRYSRIVYSYNADGLLEKECYFHKDGRPADDAMDMSCKHYFYSGSGRKTRIEFRDLKGDLVGSDFGAAVVEYTYDRNDSITGEFRLSPEGEPAVWDLKGPPTMRYFYYPDRPGERVMIMYDGNDKPLHKGIQYLDQEGHRYREEYYPKIDSAYTRYIKYRRDSLGKLLYEKEYSADGTFITGKRYGLVLKMDGWEVPEQFPAFLDHEAVRGNKSVQIEVDSLGHIIDVRAPDWSGSPIYYGLLMDYLRGLQLKKVSDDFYRNGSMIIRPRPH